MEDSNVQIKVKGQRKSKKKEVEQKVELPSLEHEEEEHVEEQVEEHEEVVEEKPKKKAAPTTKKKPTVEVEDYDVERQPDVVIHKRHKGAKPRKIIVVTGDSSANESDEDLPYRKKPNIQIKKRSAKKPEPEPETEPEPEPPKPKPARKQNVGLVTEKPHVVDTGKGMSQRYADQATKKSGYVVDEMIDKLLGLS